MNQLAKQPETSSPQNPMSLLVGADMSQIDTVKLKELMEMQERWEDRQAERAFNTALANFQAEMPPVFKRRKEQSGKYCYASYDDIMYLARPILKANGLAISCSQSEGDESLTIEMTISHKEGHSRKTTYTTRKDGPIKTKEGRNVTTEAQAQASSNTYARRTCLCNALDIVVTDEDDDGQAAGNPKISEEQATAIYNAMEKLPPERRKGMLEWIGAEKVEDIHAADYQKVMKNLQRA